MAARSGLRVGDIIIALDGQPPRSRCRTDLGLNFGRAQQWTVLRHGMTLRLGVAQTAGSAAWEPLLLVIIAGAYWVNAAFVQLSKGQEALTRQFVWLTLTMALALGLSPAVVNDVVWVKALEVLAYAVLPALFLHFFLWFAQGAPPTGWPSRVVRSLGAWSVGAGGFYLATGLTGSEWNDAARSLLLAPLALGFLGGLLTLLEGYYRRPRSPQHRQQIGIVLLGVAVAVLPLTLVALVPVSIGQLAFAQPQFAAFSLVALPLSVTYAILRRRLWEIEIVGRLLVHGVMLLFLAGCYVLFFYELNRIGLGRETQSNPVLVVIFFATVVLTFLPVQDRVRGVIDHLLYGDRYEHAQTLRALGAQLASLCPIDEALAAVAEGLASALDLRGVAIFLRQPGGDLAMRVATTACRDAAVAQPLLQQAAWQFAGAGIGADSGQWLLLVAQGDGCGLLYLGAKRTATSLSAGERRLAETLASQVSLAIANTLLVERLQAKVAELELLRDRLLHVQEQERQRLAEELHDGPYHTLLDVVHRADAIAQTLPPDDATALRLHGLIERGQDAADELRMVFLTLYPSHLAHLGLAPTLAYLARTTSCDENLIVHFSTIAFPMEQRLPKAIEEALYRMARQAMDNVLSHAQARTATIELALDEQQAVLTVRDDGRGFTLPASPVTLLRRGHLGLVSMRRRIEGLGGAFAITTVPGAGTEIRARVPVVAGGGAPGVATHGKD